MTVRFESSSQLAEPHKVLAAPGYERRASSVSSSFCE